MVNSFVPNNFMILYDGREGSSAIISMLSAQEGVCVPVFEDLDRKYFEINHPDEPLADVIDAVYRDGRYDIVERHPGLFAPGDGPVRSIGFKARLFGNAKLVAPVLKARNATAFVLSRRNFDDVVSSLYLLHHERAASPIRPRKGGNRIPPQFKLLDLDANEKKVFLDQYNSMSIPADPFDLSRVAKRVAINRHRVLRDATIIAQQGIKIIPIVYEDFIADRVAFVRTMLGHLGFPSDWPIQDRTKFDKVNVKPAKSKLRFPRVHPAWVPYTYHRRSYGLCLAELANLGGRTAA